MHSSERLFYDVCKWCAYLVSQSLPYHGTDTVDELVAHGVEDEHFVFSLGHLPVVVGASSPGSWMSSTTATCSRALRGWFALSDMRVHTLMLVHSRVSASGPCAL